jgi:hypothetical protein
MKLIVWGTGIYADGYAKYILRNELDTEIIAFADNCPKCEMKRGIQVLSANAALTLNYDRIAIAVKSEDNVAAIESQLKQAGADDAKVVVALPPISDTVWNEWHLGNVRAECIKDIAQYMKEENIQGSVAEAGVFRGDTAKLINYHFRDRLLYLFDTFGGFDARDIEAENSLGSKAFIGGGYNNVGGLSNPDIDYVMKRMPYPANVILKPGFVPETFAGIEDAFCFVNLDMDLYAPMFEGLKFFYGNMSRKGIILLHDYFLPDLPGVKKAVRDFEEWLGEPIPKIPIGDGCTLAIVKN